MTHPERVSVAARELHRLHAEMKLAMGEDGDPSARCETCVVEAEVAVCAVEEAEGLAA